MAGTESSSIAIKEKVAAAGAQYRFRCRDRDDALVRYQDSRSPELLVEGEWVRIGRPPSLETPGEWKQMEVDDLYWHTIDYLIPDLDRRRLGWFSKFGGRLRRSALGRRIVPPPYGGAGRVIEAECSERVRRVFLENFAGIKKKKLAELQDQAQRGYDLQRERNATIDQRANFFLGATGLSTTLVLANASVLLSSGGGALDTPWRQLSAATLAFASICAILAGIRGMQAIMLGFSRITPARISDAFNWEEMTENDLGARSYLTGLLVAQERELYVGDWKLARLGEARRWFGGTVLGVVVVTGFVLAEVL